MSSFSCVCLTLESSTYSASRLCLRSRSHDRRIHRVVAESGQDPVDFEQAGGYHHLSYVPSPPRVPRYGHSLRRGVDETWLGAQGSLQQLQREEVDELTPFSFPSSPLLSSLADLIERAQFARNQIMYTPGGFEELKEKGFEGTWLDWFLREIETFHGGSCESSLLQPQSF